MVKEMLQKIDSFDESSKLTKELLEKQEPLSATLFRKNSSPKKPNRISLRKLKKSLHRPNYFLQNLKNIEKPKRKIMHYIFIKFSFL